MLGSRVIFPGEIPAKANIKPTGQKRSVVNISRNVFRLRSWNGGWVDVVDTSRVCKFQHRRQLQFF